MGIDELQGVRGLSRGTPGSCRCCIVAAYTLRATCRVPDACHRVAARDLRDEALALLANVLSGGQAAGIVDGRVGPRDRRLHVAQAGRGGRRRRGTGTHFYYANYNFALILIDIIS